MDIKLLLKQIIKSYIKYLIVAGIILSNNIYGQMSTSASIMVTATIPPSVTLVNEQNLNLGSILPGVTETVQPTQINSGRVKLMGTPGAEIFLSFMLPSRLASEKDTLSIEFGKNSASVSETSTGFTNSIQGDPNIGFAARVGSGNHGIAGELFLFLGCTVSPRKNQQPGNYSGEARVTVIYTGN